VRTSTARRAAIGIATIGALALAACSSGSDDGTGRAEAAAPTTSDEAATTTSSSPESTDPESTDPESTDPESTDPESTDPDSTDPESTSTTLLPTPIEPVPPLLDDAKVDEAVDQLDDIVNVMMEETGVPGIAVGVVYKDEVIFAEGYGVREVGGPDAVDADTVFQVASVSKPVTSTIVAGVVGQGKANWTDPVITWNPDFALSDPYVTAHATLADLLSHRSGLYTGSGDLLEDLGWSQEDILPLLDQQPLDAFRSTYNYSNFGVTLGGVSAADAAQMPWPDLADSMLFEPLGMTSSSYRHADYEARENKALIHTRIGPAEDKDWEARYVRNADAEAPAGGLSSSVTDMVQFLRLQLGHGTVDGTEVVDADALQVTHVPH